jgi:hypothetical protein
VVFSVETALASFPMVLIVPTVSALTGAAWAISHPPDTVQYGLVVHEGSFLEVLANGVAGAIGGLLALTLLMFAWSWARYRVLGGGDRIWQALYCGRHNRILLLELRCRPDVVPADPLHLGETECWIKTPAGHVLRVQGHKQAVEEPNGLMVFAHTEREAGRYEVRWYAAREGEKWREIARHKFHIEEDEPDIPWMWRGDAR